MDICWFITTVVLLHSCTPGGCIVGGYESAPHSRPYMVYIRDSKTHSSCGGFLIREDFVMTVAHCKGMHLKVYLGVNDTRFLPHGIEVDYFPHPNFKYKPSNDIMLLKLKTQATLNESVSIIDLPKPWNEKISKDCLVMGWGSTKHEHYSPSTVLRELNLTLDGLTNCSEPDILCSEDRVGPSKGESGSPFVCGVTAVGITSFNLKKPEDYITGYILISQHLLWINEVMKAPHRMEPGTTAHSPVTKQVDNTTLAEPTSTERPTSESSEGLQRLNICIKTPSP